MEPSPFHRDLPFLFLNFPCYMNLHPDFTNSFSVFMVKEQELMIMFYIDYYRWLMMVAYHHFFVADLPFFWGVSASPISTGSESFSTSSSSSSAPEAPAVSFLVVPSDSPGPGCWDEGTTLSFHSYPLVKVYITMERSTILIFHMI